MHIKELVSILNLQNFSPAVSPAFNNNCAPGCTVTICSCTTVGYWSSTTDASFPPTAWLVFLDDGFVSTGLKSSGKFFVRAVRGGRDS